MGDPVKTEVLIPTEGQYLEPRAPKCLVELADMWNVPSVYLFNELVPIEFGMSYFLSGSATNGSPPHILLSPKNNAEQVR